MRLNGMWIVIAIALFSLGLFGSKKDTKKAAAKNQPQASAKFAPSTQPAKKAEASKTQPSSVAEEAEDEEDEEADTIPRVPTAKIPKVPGQTDVRVTQLKVGTAAANEAAKPAMDVLKTQKQIREILRLNESLKVRYKSQAGEIQKISEQARIHQKILQDLEKTKTGGSPAAAITPGKAKNAVEEQKIKLIQQETDQQHKFIKKLEEGTPPAEARKEAVKTSEAKVQ